jgi:hypothetical protein
MISRGCAAVVSAAGTSTVSPPACDVADVEASATAGTSNSRTPAYGGRGTIFLEDALAASLSPTVPSTSGSITA